MSAKYSVRIIELREEAKNLGVSQATIDRCGDDEDCLIIAIELEEELQNEQNNNLNMNI
jgi:hypothetical protein